MTGPEVKKVRTDGQRLHWRVPRRGHAYDAPGADGQSVVPAYLGTAGHGCAQQQQGEDHPLPARKHGTWSGDGYSRKIMFSKYCTPAFALFAIFDIISLFNNRED